MRYFPGIVLCLMALAIFVYNTQVPDAPFNIPFLDELGLADRRAERGQLTWQLLGGLGVVLIVVAGLLAAIKPKPEPLLHDESADEIR